jgi:hypothetical protein
MFHTGTGRVVIHRGLKGRRQALAQFLKLPAHLLPGRIELIVFA